VSALNRSTMLVNELESILARLLDSASFLRLQRNFQVARVVIALWLLVAAGGVLAFVYAVRTPRGVDVPAAPVAASLRVHDDDRAYVTHRLGDRCDYRLDAVPVVVLDVESGTATVVTVPTAFCQPVRLEVAAALLTAPPPEIGGN
jgi:hypothetical protein